MTTAEKSSAPERLWADPADAKVGDGVCFVTFNFPVTSHNVEYVRADTAMASLPRDTDIVAALRAEIANIQRQAETQWEGWIREEGRADRLHQELEAAEDKLSEAGNGLDALYDQIDKAREETAVNSGDLIQWLKDIEEVRAVCRNTSGASRAALAKAEPCS